MNLPCPAHTLIPHRDSMLLIDTLLSAEDGAGRVVTRLKTDNVAVRQNGRVAPLIFIELMAQAYAAVKGWEIMKAGLDFPIGYLVGVQKYQHMGQAYAEEELTIHVETVGEFEGFAVVDGSVWREETQIAQGRIKLWVPEEEA